MPQPTIGGTANNMQNRQVLSHVCPLESRGIAPVSTQPSTLATNLWSPQA